MFEKLLRNKRGVSEIIGSLLLILIITSAGVVVYAYSVNAFNTSSSSIQQQTRLDEEQTLERLHIIRVWFDSSSNQFNLTVLNYGEINWAINAVYINGTPVNPIQVTNLNGASVSFTAIDQLALLRFNSPIAISFGSVCEILVVTERGGKTSVSWKA
jgi:flagellin-like protein